MIQLFPVNGAGVISGRDSFIISGSSASLNKRLVEFADIQISDETIRTRYDIRDNSMWSMKNARENFSKHNFSDELLVNIAYRPFDIRHTYYQTDVLFNMRKIVMKHMVNKDNISLTLCKQFKTGNEYYHCFISKNMIESAYVSNRTSEITSQFPLYLYSDSATLDGSTRTPNLDATIWAKISESL